jgi:aspartate 1-decarboxylase
MNAAALLPFEKVAVYDVDNGNRFETYVIEGEAGRGDICVNGAAARMVEPGHKLIIACYCLLHEGEVLNHRPRLVFVDEKNRVRELREAETAMTVS